MTYSVSAASRVSGVSEARIRNIIRDGHVEPKRDGRRFILTFADVARIKKIAATRPARTVPASQLALPLGLPSAAVREHPASAKTDRAVEALRDDAALNELTDPLRALRLYEQIAAQTNAPDDWANLLAFLHECGRRAQAISLARRLRAALRDSALVQYNCGVVMHSAGSLAEAAEAYETALELDGALVDAHRFLHQCYDMLGRAQLAIRHANAWRRLGQQ